MYSTALQVLRGCLAKFHCEREICIQNLELRLWQSFGCGDFAVAEAPKPGTSWQLGLTRQRFGPIRIGKICVMRQFVSICSDKSSSLPCLFKLQKGFFVLFAESQHSLHSTDRQITKETTGLHWQDALFAPRQNERRTDGVHPTLQSRESSIQDFVLFPDQVLVIHGYI